MAKVKVAGTGVVCLSHLMYFFLMKVSSEEDDDSLNSTGKSIMFTFATIHFLLKNIIPPVIGREGHLLLYLCTPAS